MNDLKKVLEALEKEREVLRAKVHPFRQKRDELVEKIAPVREEIRALGEQIRSIEQPRLAELDNEIGALYKAMGGKAMSKGN